jgi:hypothetical protein
MLRRLPGFRFEVPPPPLGDVLPRMDVAVFVGFAAAGPLHCPVPVDDPAQFAAIFGADAPLVWDAGRGEHVSAYLGPAVRAFLNNGGRRCWVVRTADERMARSNIFPIPGLMQARFFENGSVELRPAFARARSEGRWSDAVRIGAALTVQPVVVQAPVPAAIGGALTLLGVGAVRPGDLLRLRYLESGLTALVAIDTAKTEIGSPPTPASSELLRLSGRALWFMPAVSTSPPEPATHVTLYTGVEGRSIALIGAVDIDEAGAIRILLPLKRMDAPPPGALLRIDGAQPIWMLVQAAHEHAGDVLGQPTVEAVGAGLRWLPVPPAPPAEIPVCERLRLELHARVGDADPLRLSELDFVAGAARFWGALPTDAQLFDAEESPLRDQYSELWRGASAPRFPVAGDQSIAFTFPLEMQLFPEHFLRPAAPTASALQRDGLARFDASLFLDAGLDDALTANLMARADYIRYLAPNPRKLRGMHAALAVEEATLIAVPDAVHGGWEEFTAAPMPPSQALDPLLRLSWWHAQGCDPIIKPID